MADELTAEQREQIDAEIFAGRKIQAIKATRAATGVDLLAAKNVVEGRERQLRQSSPDRFSAPAGKSGCAGMIVLCLCLLAPLLLWILRIA